MDIADQVGEEAFLLGAGVETTPLACYSPMHAVAGWLAFPTADCLRPETVLRRHATPARTQSFRKEGHGATLNAVPPEAHQPAWGDFSPWRGFFRLPVSHSLQTWRKQS